MKLVKPWRGNKLEVFPFQVYGDNLDECHKFCEILIEYGSGVGFNFIEMKGNIDRPLYIFEIEHDNLVSKAGLLVCGRYDDWSEERKPIIGHEDPDIILCCMSQLDKVGDLILGIEFNDAIAAGNNAWQRFPRISHAAEKKVPFLYVMPICDAEIKGDKLRSIRHPNVSIQIGQLILMIENGSLSLTVFKNSPWYEEGKRREMLDPSISLEGEKYLSCLTIALIIKEISKTIPSWTGYYERLFNDSVKYFLSCMLRHINYFIDRDFTLLNNNVQIVDYEENNTIQKIMEIINNNGSNELNFYKYSKSDITEHCIPFKKITSTNSLYKEQISPIISYTLSRERIERYNLFWGLTGEEDNGELCERKPLSYKIGANEVAFIFNINPFVRLLSETYRLDETILSHLGHSEAILFLPLAGYVRNTGGPAFSRPDKGMVSLANTLFANNTLFVTRLVLLYSQLTPEDWIEKLLNAKIERETNTSMNTNNLWRELASFSTCVISDRWSNGVVL